MAAHTTHTMSNGTLSKLVDHMCSHEGGNSVIQAIKLVREVAKAPSTATELPEAIQKTQAGFDLAAFYSNFMKTHTYREWEEFLGALAQGKSKL